MPLTPVTEAPPVIEAAANLPPDPTERSEWRVTEALYGGLLRPIYVPYFPSVIAKANLPPSFSPWYWPK